MMILAVAVLCAAPSGAQASPGDCCKEKQKAELCPLTAYQVIEAQANTFTVNRQERTAVAADGDGNILVVWASRRQESGTYGVFAQRFDPLGRPLGTEIHVNQFLPSSQREPAVTFDSDGTAWVTWQSLGQDGSRSGIYMRRFGTVEGTFGPIGDESLVNTTTDGEQITPGIAANDAGQVLIAWSSNDQHGQLRIVARIFNGDGSAATGELDLCDARTTGWDRLPVVAAMPEGRFLVAWAHTSLDKRPESIRARFVDSENKTLKPFIISDPLDDREQIEPAIAATADGTAVIAWLRSRVSDGYDVVARRMLPDGSAAGDIILVSDRNDGWKSGASVAAAADGRFIVAYNLFGEKDVTVRQQRLRPPASIYAQMYDAAGATVGEVFRVNRFDEGQQCLPVATNATHIAWSALNQIAFAWTGRTESDKKAAALTLFAPKSLTIAAPPLVEPLAAAGDVTAADVKAAPDFNPDWVPESPIVDIQAAGPDFGFMAFQTTAWQPPDPDMSVGPNHIVSVVNMDIRVHTKAGTLISSELFEDFFAGQSGGDFLFDPVTAYDHHANRFVVVTADHLGSRDGLNMAVSKTDDPTDGWHKYFFQTDHIGSYIDFENLGIGTDAYYVTADYFSGGGNVIHIFEKAPMLTGSPVTLKHIQTSSSLLSLGAVKTYDSAPPAQYFATSWTSTTRLRLFAVRNATGTPTLDSTDITVPSFTYPPDATQMGSSNRLDTIDYRIKSGVYRNGSMWVTHSIGESSTARVRWYEIDMGNWPISGTPALVQSGTFNFGSGQHSWFPDITVSNDGDAVITCSRSSSSDYPYIARLGRKSYDANGTFRASIRLKESDGPSTSTRWGDYSGNDEDPVDPGVVWSHTIYNSTGSDWRTWVGKTDTDKLMVLDDPGPINPGSSVTLSAHSAAAFGTVYFTYSVVGMGSKYVASLNATLDLASPKLASFTTADGNGDASITANVPGSAQSGPLYIQTIEENNTSNVISTSIN